MWTFSCLICPSVGDVPQSLPTFLVVRCGNPSSWIYSDQKCDGTNNCGDCSDELSPGGDLDTGRAGAGGQAVVRGQRLTREAVRLPHYIPSLHPRSKFSTPAWIPPVVGGSLAHTVASSGGLYFCGGKLAFKETDEETDSAGDHGRNMYMAKVGFELGFLSSPLHLPTTL